MAYISFTVKENHNDPEVSEIHRYKPKSLLLQITGVGVLLILSSKTLLYEAKDHGNYWSE